MEKMPEIKLNAGSKEKTEEEFRKEINAKIGVFFAGYNNIPSGQRNFSNLLNDLLNLKYEQNFNTFDFDRSWNTELINQLLNSFDEKNQTGKKGEDIPAMLNLITTEAGTEGVSDVFAEVITQKINQGEVFSPALLSIIKEWNSNIQMVNPEHRLELLNAFISHPGQVGREVLEDMLMGYGLYGSVLVDDLREQLRKNAEDPKTVLNIIDALEYISRAIDWGPASGFEDAANKAINILEEIKKNNKNYFVTLRLETAENIRNGNYQSEHMKLMSEYENPKIRKNGPLPLEARLWLRPAEFAGQCAYSDISPKYGAIYNPQGDVDSFFSLSEEGGNLRYEDIIMREAPEIYGKMEQEKRQLLMENYRTLMNVHYRHQIEEKLGLKINLLTAREQIQFINFISDKETGEMEEIEKFINKTGNKTERLNKVKAFLSLEYNNQNGARVLEMERRLDSESSALVFAKIAELANLAQAEANKLRRIFVDKENLVSIIPDIKLEFLKKAHQIILDFSGEEKDTVKLLKDLEDSKIEITLLSALLKTFREKGKTVDYKLIKDLALETKEPENDLTPEEKEEVLALFEKNYREEVFPDDPQAAEAAIKEMKEDLFSKKGLAGQQVFTLRFQNQMIAFCRFKSMDEKDFKFLQLENSEPDALFAKSLNVHKDVNKLSVGRYFSDTVLNLMRQNHPLYAITRENNPANPMYEKQGFIIDKNSVLRKSEAPQIGYYRMKMEKTGQPS